MKSLSLVPLYQSHSQHLVHANKASIFGDGDKYCVSQYCLKISHCHVKAIPPSPGMQDETCKELR